MRPVRARGLLTGVIALAGAGVVGYTLGSQTPDVVADAPMLMWVLAAAVIVGELLPVQVVMRGAKGRCPPPRRSPSPC